jgi:hypothetical protein
MRQRIGHPVREIGTSAEHYGQLSPLRIAITDGGHASTCRTARRAGSRTGVKPSQPREYRARHKARGTVRCGHSVVGRVAERAFCSVDLLG